MSQSRHSSINKNKETVSVEFCTKNIKRKKWLLQEILEDVKNLCKEHNTMPFINDTKTLPLNLKKTFKDQTRFFNSES